MRYFFSSRLNELWYFYLRKPAGLLFLLLSQVLFFLGLHNRAIKHCARSCRYAESSSSNRLLKKLFDKTGYSHLKFSSGITLSDAATRSIILKWPDIDGDTVKSKGILLITFTKTFSYYLNNTDLNKLHHYFYVVLEPSWSGYADPDILGFFDSGNKVIIQSSEMHDRIFLNHFLDHCIPVSFGASDWVNPYIFNKTNTEKIYDSVYIANTNPIKRVLRYLEAVKTIVQTQDPDYKACLVCAAWGGAETLLRGLVESFKLEKNLTLLIELKRPQVIEVLNQSKVNILLSLKEGSNRSLFEALFCGVPIILASENIGVNKSYVNENTGLLLDNNAIENGLLWMKDNHHRYDTRTWALANIAPDATTAKLARIINTNFDEEFTDLLIKTNSPEVCYLDQESIDHAPYTQRVLELLQKNNGYSTTQINNDLLKQKNLFLEAINGNF